MAMNAGRRAIVRLVLLVAAGYLLLVLNLYFRQAGLLYLPDFPGASSDATPYDIGLEYQPVALQTEDGLQLDAWLVPAAEKRGVILFCHGNAGNISNRLSTLKLFNELGFATLIFDYRGYGRSEGEPDEAGTYLDAEAAWQYLRRQGYAEEELVLFGRSLGGAVATHLASRYSPAALVIDSSFTSVPDLAAELYPQFPVRWLSRFSYDSLSRISAIEVPVLVMHSRDDEIIPFSHGQRLFEAANQPKQFVEFRGGHNDYIYTTGLEFYRNVLNRFFGAYVDRR